VCRIERELGTNRGSRWPIFAGSLQRKRLTKPTCVASWILLKWADEPEDVKPRAIEVAGAGGNHLASLGLCFLRQCAQTVFMLSVLTIGSGIIIRICLAIFAAAVKSGTE
jgi:hypothetical protein